MYVNQRLLNINGNNQPKQSEVLLDESYCHVDHHARKTWAAPGATVFQRGRGPMLVTFAAFVVYQENQRTRANMIKERIKVWSVKGSRDVQSDYHGNFSAEKFEQLFENLCWSLMLYEWCSLPQTPQKPTEELKKNELSDLVKTQKIESAFATYKIANKYGHITMITPAYHCELQLIEKVWAMIKNLIDFNPDRNETPSSLKTKLDEGLEKTPEEHFLSAL
ncbi:hypothetical protein CU098_009553 [Rhizopus stolonifer]|uniref:Tc1-like transposase DDE domain-containing protein n=1 Tax=Rhizopus stolonifer TaxID=4846 RepID=A0A367JS41_RHIST|nr:hypothetical protein CU098_009553 [Rhizopus stolonifer]